MNRRNFLSNIVKAAGLFTILPPSTTYERIWKATKPELIINPEYVDAEYEAYIMIDYNKLPNYLAKNQIEVDNENIKKNWTKFAESLNSVTYKFNQGEVIKVC